MYEGIRLLPCVSTPRRSAEIRQSAIIVAWVEGVWFAVRSWCRNVLRVWGWIRWSFCLGGGIGVGVVIVVEELVILDLK